MRDVLSSVLAEGDEDGEARDRILAAAFFRKRPLQAGAVAPEARPQLFTPFFSTKEHGQGIGLTLVQEILANHKFGYALDGPAGGPTVFTVVFD